MKLNVGILRGGAGSEYETSIRSGGAALLHLNRDKYRPVDLLVARDGVLHADGAPIETKDLRSIVDVVFNTLHGGPGEDGTVQKIFDDLKIPHTGSGSEKILNKYLVKKELGNLGMRTPFGITFSLPKEFESEEDFEGFVLTRAKYVFGRISPSWIIKPTLGGSSKDTFIARDFSELVLALKEVLRKYDHVLVEEYVKGREMTMGWVGGFRGKENYFLMPAEIYPNGEAGRVKNQYPILDEETRRTGNYRVIHPRDLDKEEREGMQNFMIEAKKKLGLRHYFTADFIVTPHATYLLEVDALPAIDEHAILPKSLESVGSSLSEFLDHAIHQALK